MRLPDDAMAAAAPLSRPPLERMMRIHQVVRSARGEKLPNATTLAREMEVSTKTISRDLEFMRDRLGLPLEYDEKRFGWRYTEEVEAFPTLQISEGELFALLVAEKALQQYRGTSFERRLVGAFQKLARSLPDTVSLNLAEWDQTISFHTSAEPLLDLGVIDTLATAASRRQQLRLRYRKPGASEAEERVVDPYHLANVNGDWYLFAFDHLRKAIRTFAPGRIASAEPTGKHFERPAKFTLPRELKDSFGVHSRQGDFTVVAEFDASVAGYIREKRWHPSQQLSDGPGGGVTLRLRLGSLVEVQRWLLGWGGAVRVLEPAELAASMRDAARRILAANPGE